jgi:hypothetical protein
MGQTVMTLARYYALRDAKADLRRQGRRLWDTTAAELRLMAADWLRQHPQLIEQATGAVEKDPVLRRIAERENRRLSRRVTAGHSAKLHERKHP